MSETKPRQKRSTFGPTITPREYPRPQKPSLYEGLSAFLRSSTRAPLIGALLYRYVAEPKLLGPLAKYLVKHKGLSERMAFAVMLTLVQAGTYLTTWGFFEFIEKSGWFEAYRIRRTPGQEPTAEMRAGAVKEAAMGWPGMLLVGQFYYWLQTAKCGSPNLLGKTASLFDLFKQYVVSIVLVNVTFYWSHRLLHSKFLYERFHKVHHEFVGVRSMAAQSAHPVETTVEVIPQIIGPMLMQMHPTAILHFFAWRVYQGMEEHSGYHFRGTWLHKLGLTFADENLQHDCHHLESHKGNFGTFWCDWLFDSQDFWLKVGQEDGYIELCKKREQDALERDEYYRKLDEEKEKQKAV